MRTFTEAKAIYDKTAAELRKTTADLDKARREKGEVIRSLPFRFKMTDEEQEQRRSRITAELEPIERRVAELEAKKTFLSIQTRIELDNVRQARAAELLPVFVEIWNNYSGKRYGDKTREKISAELDTKTGARVRVESGYSYVTVTFYDNSITDLVITFYRDNNKLLEENVIQAIETADTIRLDNCGEYCEASASRAREIIRRLKRAEQAEADLRAAVDAFNELLPSKHDRAYFQVNNLYL